MVLTCLYILLGKTSIKKGSSKLGNSLQKSLSANDKSQTKRVKFLRFFSWYFEFNTKVYYIQYTIRTDDFWTLHFAKKTKINHLVPQ